MKVAKITALSVLFITLSGFNFAEESNAPKNCHYVDSVKARTLVSAYVTKTQQIIGWYLCDSGSRANLNDIQIAVLSEGDTINSFRNEYVKQNVNDAKSARYDKRVDFHGAKVHHAEVSQTTNPYPMMVDFYFIKKNSTTYALIYKDNHTRYKTTSVSSRTVIAEVLDKLRK